MQTWLARLSAEVEEDKSRGGGQPAETATEEGANQVPSPSRQQIGKASIWMNI